MMRHEQITELLGAFALDAVDGDERSEIETHLVDCAKCRAEVAEHREVAALLAHGGASAPDGLWDRIAGSLEETAPRLDMTAFTAPTVPATSARARAARRWAPTPIGAAVVAAAAALLLFVAGPLDGDDDGPRVDSLVVAFETALDDPDSRTFALASGDRRLVVQGAITEDGTGLIRASSLPQLPPNRTYQLWGMGGATPISLGLLGGDPAVVSFAAADFTTFAITEEDAGGAVSPTSTPVASGSVEA